MALSWSFLPPRPPTRKPHWPLRSQYHPRPWSTWGSWVPSGLPPDSWEAGGFWIHKDSTRYPGKTSRDVKGFGRTTNRSKIFLTYVLPFFGGYLTCEIQTTNSSTKKTLSHSFQCIWKHWIHIFQNQIYHENPWIIFYHWLFKIYVMPKHTSRSGLYRGPEIWHPNFMKSSKCTIYLHQVWSPQMGRIQWSLRIIPVSK